MKNTFDYTQNVTEFPTRNISTIWKPQSIEELQEIVDKASIQKRPLYPISTGHNWGLGSKLPIMDSDLVVLERLNEIIEVNEELAFARIQPGVTQQQLSDYLKERHPDFILNVTGSDAHSSILANALERGSGKNGQRANDIREIKLMLASGKQITTGFGGYDESDSAPFYKYGIGPDLTHLFTQSNYGIVTEGVISLLPKQPFTLFLTTIANNDLGSFLSVFSNLVRKGVVGNSLEIDSQNDPKIFELFEKHKGDEEWVSWFVIYGDEEIRLAKNKLAIKMLGEVCAEIKSYDSEDEHTSAYTPVKVRLSRYQGIPSDHSLLSTARAFGVELDENNPDIDLHKKIPGFRCVLPVIPFSRKGAEIIDFINEFSRIQNLETAISIIALDHYSLEVFARVYFDRQSPSEIERVASWARTLLVELKKIGIYPYRLDVENMIPYLSNVNDPLRNLKDVIKKHMDPDGIIAPGRYHLINLI